MGLSKVTMVESETTCAVEGINGLVWFNMLGGTGHLSGPNSRPLVLQLGDGRRYGWKPAPVASGFGP